MYLLFTLQVTCINCEKHAVVWAVAPMISQNAEIVVYTGLSFFSQRGMYLFPYSLCSQHHTKELNILLAFILDKVKHLFWMRIETNLTPVSVDSTHKHIHPSSTPGIITTTFDLTTELLLQPLHLLSQLNKSLLCLIELFEVNLQ